MTGYIVGWVEGQVLSSGAHFTVPATVASNILLAASPNETNVANCIPVQLSNGTDVRTALNLQNNSANLGKQVTIKGNLESYFGTAGIKSTTAYAWGDKGDENGTTTPTIPEGSGDGTEANPFDVAQVLAGATGTGVWMDCYIVGWVEGQVLSSGAHFDVPATVASNILVAATPGETNVANCVPVQLVNKTDIRTELNLVDNPSNLGKHIIIQGNLESYFGAKGMKSPTAYKEK